MKTRSSSRAAQGLPPKRPSYDLEDVKQTRPAKRPRLPPKQKFPLMKLPAEIRLRILRELLWQAEPLEYFLCSESYSDLSNDVRFNVVPRPMRTNFKLNPAILRACRQLHREGWDILYRENTFQLKIWHSCDDPAFYVCQYMGRAQEIWELAKRPAPLYRDTEKLYIRVEMVGVGGQCERASRNVVREVVKVLRDMSNWSHLTIYLSAETCSESPVCDSKLEPDEKFLKPFGLVRNRSQVIFEGISSELTDSLTKLMTGTSPIVNLPQMYEELAAYVNDHMFRDDAPPEVDYELDAAEEFMNEENEEMFLESRELIFFFLDEYFRSRVERLFRHDANPTLSRTKCQQFVFEEWGLFMAQDLPDREQGCAPPPGDRRRLRAVSV